MFYTFNLGLLLLNIYITLVNTENFNFYSVSLRGKSLQKFQYEIEIEIMKVEIMFEVTLIGESSFGIFVHPYEDFYFILFVNKN